MITPYYSHGGITIYHARNEQIVPHLTGVGALVGDPPYGGDYDTDYERFTGGVPAARRNYPACEGDDQPFDPTPWLDYPEVILWGYQHFADRVPLGTILAWVKRDTAKYGVMLSDAELGWQKGGQGVYCYEHVWDGFNRATERGQRRVHPMQKPVALFVWAIQRLHLPPGTLILDPWMGSGPTLKAAKLLGYPAIGIESVETYCAAAAQDLTQEVLPLAV